MDQQAFERQVATELRDMAGVPAGYDAMSVARTAKASKPARSVPRLGRGLGSFAARAAGVGIAAAIVGIFGGFMLFGVILGPDDGELTGASPSASVSPAPTSEIMPATFPPAEVTHASGALVPIEPGGSADEGPDVDHTAEGLDVLWYGATRYRVTSTDPRLAGVATIVHTEAYWDHETTTDDIDAGDAGGTWQLELYVARVEITNEQGTWSGSVGPAFFASGTGSVDGSTEGSPGFTGVAPAILEGSGAYEGLSLLMQLVNNEVPDTPEMWVPDGSQPSTFEAIVVNRTLPGPPSDGVWDRLTDR